MITKPDKNKARLKRHVRVRAKISGTPECPRLDVFRSAKHIYAQIIDDVNGVTLCAASSMGYNATIYDDGDKEQKKQVVLNRACQVLSRLPASLLKVRLLAYMYGEVYEESLLQEAHAIIDGWGKEVMTAEQVELVKELRNIEENPYPFEEVE